MKKIALACILVVSFSTIAFVFFHEDVKNRLPSNKPDNIERLTFGMPSGFQTSGKMTLVHFFNPDCPCSRFNTQHLNELVRAFSAEVEFVAYSTSEPPKKYPIKVIEDKNGLMAQKLGVYSTPQAVLLAADGKVLYSGNYNTNRYCSNDQTAFVKIAISKALIADTESLSQVNLKSGLPYGCSIFKNQY